MIEKISQLLGEIITGSQISGFLASSNIRELETGTSTKWRRLNENFISAQETRNNASLICDCIEKIMEPVCFVKKQELYEQTIEELNTVLAFEGLEISKNGKLKARETAKTLSEAQVRANSLKAALERRNAHGQIKRFCNAELLADNYFHAVLEAAKSICSRIRELSEINKDGRELFEAAFSTKLPILMINGLTTESELAEQKGFISLLVGVYGTFRSPLAHESKINWAMSEEDALDMMSTISYIHRRLDSVTRTGIPYSEPKRG